MSRELYRIAADIQLSIATGEWSKRASVYAAPYIEAMASLKSVADNFGHDSGKSVVNYFLANAGTWRGPTARRIKAELKELVK